MIYQILFYLFAYFAYLLIAYFTYLLISLFCLFYSISNILLSEQILNIQENRQWTMLCYFKVLKLLSFIPLKFDFYFFNF